MINFLEDSLELRVINKLVASTFEKFSHGEAEAPRCVYYYMKDLYGAVFAHYADSWLPDIPPETVAETGKLVPDDGLRFPDSMWFSSNAYVKDALVEEPKTRELGFLGFDLMNRLLSAPRHDRGCPIRLMEWLAKIPMRLRQKDWTHDLQMYDLFREAGSYNELDNRYWDEWSEIGQVLLDNYSITFDPMVLIFSDYYDLQQKIYRQRAWEFFDYAGYYPGGSISRHFPILDQFEKQVWYELDHDSWHNDQNEGFFARLDYEPETK
ncbi:hypothetical protein LZL87_010952 [Fusarium oxysporum]|nr:hypothetical protein LZL87_010952 [Fusarium oxysporum]